MSSTSTSKKAVDLAVDLHRVLRSLDEARARYEAPPADTAELRQQHEDLQRQIEELDASSQQAEIDRRSAEGGVAEMNEKVEHYKQQITRVATQREYGALLQEIDAAQSQASELEEAALAALETKEEAGRRREELQASHDELAGSYQEAMESWEGGRPAAAEEIEQLETEAEVLREKMSPQALRVFETLYERHDGDPLAEVVGVQRAGRAPAMWRCSVCNYSVRPQVVVQIQTSDELVTCDCGRQRIFYLQESE